MNDRSDYAAGLNRRDLLIKVPAVTLGFQVLAGVEGLEPTTLGFGDRCSTN
jgi:hypothetical protein